MYCEYFDFTEKPFNITPDPRFLFPSKSHKELFTNLLSGISDRCGFIALSGEVGTGKTTIIRALLERLDDTSYRTALIFNPHLSAIELLRTINREFCIRHDLPDTGELLAELHRFLIEENRQGRSVVLVIDEAQNLDPMVMEQIRLIFDLKYGSGRLIRIILAGQPELDRLLALPELGQLAQCITVRYHLLPMDFDDSRSYIFHRLHLVAGTERADFAETAIREIFRFSGGAPRLINIVCDRAILVAFSGNSRLITCPMVRTAIRELSAASGTVKPPTLQRRSAYCLRIAVGIMVVIAIALIAARVRSTESYTVADTAHELLVSPQPVTRIEAAGPVGRPAVAAAVDQPQPAPTTYGTPSSTTVKMPSPLQSPPKESLASLPENHDTAINAIARLWNVPPVKTAGKGSFPKALTGSRLDHTPFNGKIGYLARLNTPAILEIKMPRRQGIRYVALTGINGSKLITEPPLPGGMDRKQLEKQWSGRGYLLWKNHQEIPIDLKQGATGIAAIRLQVLLIGAGTLKGEPSGVIDEATVAALKEFQMKKGIKADGRPGAQTLMLLYRDGGKLNTPVLTPRTMKS